MLRRREAPAVYMADLMYRLYWENYCGIRSMGPWATDDGPRPARIRKLADMGEVNRAALEAAWIALLCLLDRDEEDGPC